MSERKTEWRLPGWQRGGHGATNKSRFMKSGDEVRMGRWELGNREFYCRGSENQSYRKCNGVGRWRERGHTLKLFRTI